MFTRSSVAALVVAVCGVCCFASDASLPRIVVHDNTRAAGTLRHGVLTIELEICDGDWHPEADDGPHIGVHAFGEKGKAPSIPGPLIRVPEGTQIHATVRNTLTKEITVHGLHRRPGKDQPITLAPGEEHVFDFPAGAAGTYYYWAGPPGTTMGDAKQRWDGQSSQLSGALVTPLIPPGGKFVARMTPPRAGTFIYHTHWNDMEQLRGGLNGPLLVVENDYRPELDRSFVAAAGTDKEKPLIVNGTTSPGEVEWRAGRPYTSG